VRALFQRSSLVEAPELRPDPTLLQHVLPQLHADWARVNFKTRAIPFSNMCHSGLILVSFWCNLVSSVMFCCFPVFFFVCFPT
jgi:hypothetical protein